MEIKREGLLFNLQTYYKDRMKRGLLRTGKECLKENSHLMTCIVYSLLWLDLLLSLKTTEVRKVEVPQFNYL